MKRNFVKCMVNHIIFIPLNKKLLAFIKIKNIIVSNYQHRKFKPNAYTFDCVIFYRSQTPVVPM